MKTPKKVSYSLQLMIQLQKLSSHKKEGGFALLMTSVMAILIFSMLTVYLFSSRLSRSTANAMIDAGSTFYAAESALNLRADNMRTRVGNFSRPSGTAPFDGAAATDPVGVHIASMMQSCINPPAATTAVPFPQGSGDFACVQNDTDYSESVVTGSMSSYGQNTNISSGLRNSSNIKYKSYSFVQDLTPATVSLTVIPPNNNFAGLRSVDYLYRVYSTAIKQADNATDVAAQSMLQMQFTDRFIPIFQFAAFYEGDLEITSGTNISIAGPIHSNASIYLNPAQLLTLNGNVSYVNRIYRSLSYPSTHGLVFATDLRSILFTGGGPYSAATSAPAASCNGVANGCIAATGWATGTTNTEITSADILSSNGAISNSGVLRLPPSGFLSKTQANGADGIYYGKADLRVDFDPCNSTSPCDAVNGKFNITRMDPSGTTAVPIENFSGAGKEGLIDSLRKPVVLKVTDGRIGFSEIIRLCPKLNGTAGDPTATSNALPQLTETAFSNLANLTEFNNTTTGLANRVRLKMALQKAIIMTPFNDSSLEFTKMQSSFSSTGGLMRSNIESALDNAGIVDDAGSALTLARLNTVKSTVISAKPIHIAALNENNLTTNINGGCILPAPMQILRNTTTEPVFDKREGRNMYILQSNIKSLTVWNRDGVYGDTTTPSARANLLTLTVLPSTNEKLFTRRQPTSLATVDQFASLDTNNNTSNVANANCDYDCLGLGAVDGVRSPTAAATTQGGLVWHFALVNRTTAPYNYASNPAPASPAVAVRNSTRGVSQYGFAFSGGARLPGALTIASDQAVYIQGDYNNPTSFTGTISATDPLDANSISAVRTSSSNPAAKEKKPAAILGDSAIVLSNNCSSTNFRINCLRNFTDAQPSSRFTPPRPVSPTEMPLATSTVVRAAILAGTEATNTAASPPEVSGGLNNLISFRENWNGRTFKYRGSMVSKGIPSEFNGTFKPGCFGQAGFSSTGIPLNCPASLAYPTGLTYLDTYFYPPARDFGFDTDFNSVDGLPPLTPNVNLLIQKVYKRDYDSQNRS